MTILVDFSVSIILPTYNRSKFEKLIEYNINIQDYYNICEVLIGDDSDKDEPLRLNIKYPIHYYKLQRCSIGAKRNFLINEAKGTYVINFDTDDFYLPCYVSTSVFTLIYNNKKAAGSANMVLTNGKQYYKQRCVNLHLINEGTLIMNRKWYLESGLYLNQSHSEASYLLLKNIKDICETDTSLMCCYSHKENTIDKTVWEKDNYKHETNQFEKHIKLLSNLNI
jgi:glycosyltransferase involved in cell wall biosynthesis